MDEELVEYKEKELIASKKTPTIIHSIVDDIQSEECSSVNVTIVHHNDMDGIFSALMIRELLKTFNSPKIDIHYVEYNYQAGYNLVDKIPLGSEVFIVDLSLTESQIKNILHKVSNILIIDHHMTSIGILKDLIDNDEDIMKRGDLAFYVDVKGCGAMNIYNLFKDVHYKNKNKKISDVVNPKTIDLVDQYDRWDRKINDYHNCDYLNTYCWESSSLFVNSNIMDKLLYNRDFLQEVLQVGEELYELQQQKYKVKFAAFHRKGFFHIDGHIYRVCYMFGFGNSIAFGDDLNKYDFCMLINRPDMYGNIKVSMYSAENRVEVNELCEQLGGGGHPHAAGFSMSSVDELFKYIQ